MTNTFTTSDLALAAYLRYQGFELVSVNDIVGRPGKKAFEFDWQKGSLRADDVQDEFRRGKASVDPIRYFDEIKNLKNIIHEQ